jgi:hypothetical protein
MKIPPVTKFLTNFSMAMFGTTVGLHLLGELGFSWISCGIASFLIVGNMMWITDY